MCGSTWKVSPLAFAQFLIKNCPTLTVQLALGSKKEVQESCRQARWSYGSESPKTDFSLRFTRAKLEKNLPRLHKSQRMNLNILKTNKPYLGPKREYRSDPFFEWWPDPFFEWYPKWLLDSFTNLLLLSNLRLRDLVPRDGVGDKHADLCNRETVLTRKGVAPCGKRKRAWETCIHRKTAQRGRETHTHTEKQRRQRERKRNREWERESEQKRKQKQYMLQNFHYILRREHGCKNISRQYENFVTLLGLSWPQPHIIPKALKGGVCAPLPASLFSQCMSPPPSHFKLWVHTHILTAISSYMNPQHHFPLSRCESKGRGFP